MDASLLKQFGDFQMFPTETKVRLATNQIKRQNLKDLEAYVPNILDKSDKKDDIVWVNTGMGYLWFIRPYNYKKSSVFVSKNRANKIYLNALKIKL